MVFLLGACGSPKDENELYMTVGGTGIPNTVGVKHFYDFEQSVKEKLPEIQTKMLVYGQLGSEENLVSGLRRNRVLFANLSAIIVSEMLDEKNLKFIAWSEIGFHHVYSKSPVLKPDDLKGVRYRVSASLSSRYFAEAIGADLIPMGYGEIVQSLQTDLITAGDNSIALYVKTGKEQEAPNYTLTQHSLGMSVMVARKEWWENLTPDQQEIIEGSWPNLKQARLELREEEAENLENAENMGIQVYRLSQEERDLWKIATVGQAERLAKEIGGRSEEVLALVIKGKKDYQNYLNR